jgi:hypothetical protein
MVWEKANGANKQTVNALKRKQAPAPLSGRRAASAVAGASRIDAVTFWHRIINKQNDESKRACHSTSHRFG